MMQGAKLIHCLHKQISSGAPCNTVCPDISTHIKSSTVEKSRWFMTLTSQSCHDPNEQKWTA